MRRIAAVASLAMIIAACAPTVPVAGDSQRATTAATGNLGGTPATPAADAPFTVTPVADFDAPWALAVLPGTEGLLITEKGGRLLRWTGDGPAQAVAGVPSVAVGGQGGLGDVVLSPDFAASRMVYLSWAEAGPGGKGAAVGRGRLSADGNRLEGFATIWRATPFVSGDGHFGHRIAFGPDGMLYIATGERQAFTPAQDMAGTLGKVVRLHPDGRVPLDNPFAADGGAAAQVWSLGHRNPLGIAFDDGGRLWVAEMGPTGGDELNLARSGGNYGYPAVSNGSHYDGRDIPDHAPGDGYVAPQLWWTPVISPAGLMIYRGNGFPRWRGDAFIPALSGQGLVRVDLDGDTARAGDHWNLGARIRAVAEGADGAIWLLEDQRGTSQGRLLRLDPKR